jgi:hypothetical protein
MQFACMGRLYIVKCYCIHSASENMCSSLPLAGNSSPLFDLYLMMRESLPPLTREKEKKRKKSKKLQTRKT